MKNRFNRSGRSALFAGLIAALLSVVAAPRPAEGSTMSTVGASARVTAEIGAIYQGSADAINRELNKALRSLDSTGAASAAYTAGRSAELLENIKGVVARAGVAGVKVVSPAVQSAFNSGARLAAEQAKELGLGGVDGLASTSFAGINERTVDALARDTVAKMQRRTEEHAGNAVALFRSLSTAMAGIDAQRRVKGFSLSEREVNRVIAHGVVSGDPRAAMGAMRELIGKGAGFSPSVIEDYRKVGNQLVLSLIHI